MGFVEVRQWAYVLMTLLSVFGMVGIGVFFVRLLQERRLKYAYKTYLDGLIGLEDTSALIFSGVRSLVNTISDSFESFPHPEGDQRKTVTDLVIKIGDLLTAVDVSVPEGGRGRLQDLMGRVDQLYLCQSRHHVTAEISGLRSGLQSNLKRFNEFVSRMEQARKILKGSSYSIQYQITYTTW